ncbi:hypothetical protein C8Q80DRAFT_1116732 [Daedaleopsis nitida]|nr:hypothetical protein C8Q80DRAFT_1116732 [Daedaleopsis nitida]
MSTSALVPLESQMHPLSVSMGARARSQAPQFDEQTTTSPSSGTATPNSTPKPRPKQLPDDSIQPIATRSESPARPEQVDCTPWPLPRNIDDARAGMVFYGIYANGHIMEDLARRVYPNMVNPSEMDLLLAGLSYCREVTKAPLTLQFAYVNRNVKSWNRLVKEPVDEQVAVLYLFKYDEEEFNNRPLDKDVKKLEKALGSKATWWELKWWMEVRVNSQWFSSSLYSSLTRTSTTTTTNRASPPAPISPTPAENTDIITTLSITVMSTPPLDTQMYALSLDGPTSPSSGTATPVSTPKPSHKPVPEAISQPVTTHEQPARAKPPKQVDCRPWPHASNIADARAGVVFYGIYANVHIVEDLARKVYPDMVNPSQMDLLLAGLSYCREVAKAPVTLQFAYVNRHVKSWNRLIKEAVDEHAAVLYLFKYDKEEFDSRPLDEDVKQLEQALGSKATWWELKWWMETSNSTRRLQAASLPAHLRTVVDTDGIVPTLHLKDSVGNDTKYLTSFSSSGFANVQIIISDIIYLAKITGIVPIIEPFTSAIEVEWHKLKDIARVRKENVYDEIGCPTCTPSRYLVYEGPQSVKLIPGFEHDLHSLFWSLRVAQLAFPDGRAAALAEAHENPTRPSEHRRVLLQPDKHVVYYDFLYYACALEPFESESAKDHSPMWRKVMSHAHWSMSTVELAQCYLSCKLLGLRSHGASIPPFIAIHAHHCDLRNYCGDVPKQDCFAPPSAIARRVDKTCTLAEMVTTSGTMRPGYPVRSGLARREKQAPSARRRHLHSRGSRATCARKSRTPSNPETFEGKFELQQSDVDTTCLEQRMDEEVRSQLPTRMQAQENFLQEADLAGGTEALTNFIDAAGGTTPFSNSPWPDFDARQAA